jgi:hypothetical protein
MVKYVKVLHFKRILTSEYCYSVTIMQYVFSHYNAVEGWAQWHMPGIAALGRLQQED